MSREITKQRDPFDIAKDNIDLYEKLIGEVKKLDPHGETPCWEAAWSIVIVFYAALHTLKGTFLKLGYPPSKLNNHGKIFNVLNMEAPESLVEISRYYRVLYQLSRKVRYLGLLYSANKAELHYTDSFLKIREACEKASEFAATGLETDRSQ